MYKWVLYLQSVGNHPLIILILLVRSENDYQITQILFVNCLAVASRIDSFGYLVKLIGVSIKNTYNCNLPLKSTCSYELLIII